jgi:phenylacetic acid degradation operon negative regulatory protein
VVVWSLDELADRYRAALATFEELVGRAATADPSAALGARTQAMARWRLISRIDPVLPAELLPTDWPGWPARERFTEIYDGLGVRAEQRVREVVGQHSAEAADAVRHHTVADPPACPIVFCRHSWGPLARGVSPERLQRRWQRTCACR